MFTTRFSSLAVILALPLLAGCDGDASSKKADKPKVAKNKYAIGELVRFGYGGGAARYKGSGWGDTENESTWTNGYSAHLAFRLPRVEQPIRLRVMLLAFTNPPWLPYQPVEVIVNNEIVAEWKAADLGEYFAIIPAEVANHEQLMVEFRMPWANSPNLLRVGEDSRMLGLCFYEAAIDVADEETFRRAEEERKQSGLDARGKDYTFGTVVGFGAGGGAERFKASGWHNLERDFTWTSRAPAILKFSIPPTDRPLRLKMRLGGMVTKSLPFQPTEVHVNGERIADWEVAFPADFEAVIPPAVVALSEELRIELLAKGAASPLEMKTGGDGRVLGVRCEALIITEDEPANSTPSPSPPEQPH